MKSLILFGVISISAICVFSCNAQPRERNKTDISATQTRVNTESTNTPSKILTDAVKAIGCKIKKDNGGIIYDAKFLQWKKVEFKLISQTVITASYGNLIYFEEEIYASVEDAENRLKNFKKVSPELQAKIEEMHHKIYTELDFREAFRRDKRVYFVSITSWGGWLDGHVATYRKKLEKVIK